MLGQEELRSDEDSDRDDHVLGSDSTRDLPFEQLRARVPVQHLACLREVLQRPCRPLGEHGAPERVVLPEPSVVVVRRLPDGALFRGLVTEEEVHCLTGVALVVAEALDVPAHETEDVDLHGASTEAAQRAKLDHRLVALVRRNHLGALLDAGRDDQNTCQQTRLRDADEVTTDEPVGDHHSETETKLAHHALRNHARKPLDVLHSSIRLSIS